MIRRNKLEGRRFGRLTVLRFSHVKQNNAIWDVRCDCSNEFKADTHTLNAGRTRQCNSCRLRQLWEGNKKPDAAFMRVFMTYKRNAKRDRRAFKLSRKQFREITSSSCLFTGRAPSNVEETVGGSIYIYNGIDRLDNRKGYTKENCVPCCWEVNAMKGRYNLEEFLAVCREVTKHYGRS